LLWNVAERSHQSSIKVGNGGIFLDLAFSPDGKWLAAVLEQDESNQLVLHNLETNARQTVENVGTVTSVAFSNDNRILYAGNTDGKVWAWDISAQRVVAELCRITKEAWDVCLPLEKSAIVSLRLDPQGNKLAAGTEKALSVWDVSDLSKLKVWFHKPRLEVSQLAFSRDGQTLTILLNKHEAGTWGRDRQGGLTLLDVNTGDQLGESIPNETTSMSFALRSDGKVLASSTNAHSIDLWDLNPGSAENFCAIANTNPSEEDWNIYTGGDQKYCRICPRLPSGEGAPADAPGCKYSGWRYWWDVITKAN
jgi:WD40 repeat protein